MLCGVIRVSLFLVLLTIIAYSVCAGPSSGLINVNLSISTNLTLFSDIIDVTIFKITDPSYQPGSNSFKHGLPEQTNETKKIDQSIIWSREMNGIIHTYQAVIAPGTTWNQARDAAIAKGGHLATITSKDENDLMLSNIQNTSYWSPCRGNIFGPWLGGYQPSGSNNSSSGWAWVTGEKWEYTNWSPEEPNDYMGEEDKLFFYVNNCIPSSTWGDHRNDGDGNTAYIIEWEKPIYSPQIVLSSTNH
jgi:hypothetical protein